MASADRFVFRLDDGRVVRLLMTDRRHGDLAVGQPADVLGRRRSALVDVPWTWLEQVHGATVVAVGRPGDGAGQRADACWTTATGAALAVHVADCAPVALIAPTGAMGIAHAGWRGLELGVIENTAAAMREFGHEPTVAVVGACIGADHYEFGRADLDRLAARLGDEVRAVARSGAPALSMRAGVRAALAHIGVGQIGWLGGCTAAEGGLRWSHRARRDRQRQALVGWIADEPNSPGSDP